ncbi:MAG: hypothetical protein JXR49_17275 [Acidobacteria bacterium]|nr:hypothetical protein [Acidobacteriota bacterium]
MSKSTLQKSSFFSEITVGPGRFTDHNLQKIIIHYLPCGNSQAFIDYPLALFLKMFLLNEVEDGPKFSPPRQTMPDFLKTSPDLFAVISHKRKTQRRKSFHVAQIFPGIQVGVFRHGIQDHRPAAATDQVPQFKPPCTIEAIQRAHHTVNQSPKSICDAVHRFCRRLKSKKRPVPDGTILVQVLKIIQQLKHHSITETEISFLLFQFSFYQQAVGQYRGASFNADLQQAYGLNPY